MPSLVSKELCTGCTACANACPKKCIQMVEDDYGFWFPKVIDYNLCIECGQCEKSCPILKKEDVKNKNSIAYAAYSLDEQIRHESSSGGIFSELAKNVLNQAGVVYGAAYDELFNVQHICVTNSDDLSRLRGAKYSQSVLKDCFTDIRKRLNTGQEVLFSGTPCQVAGLKSYLRRDYSNLICIDFVCHGVPSPMAWKEYVHYRADKDCGGELPQHINLRSKETGWSKYKYSNEFTYANGYKHISGGPDSLYMKLFVGDYISRESCENCHFKGYGRVSDITLGDFWGIWDIAPEMDDDKGTSVVIVHSKKGEGYLKQLTDKIKIKEVTLEQASEQNPSMLISSKAKENRENVLNEIKIGKLDGINVFFNDVKKKVSIQRDCATDIMKYIASLLVIAIHTSPFVAISLNLNFYFVDILCRLAVPFFYVCSGYYLFNRLEFKDSRLSDSKVNKEAFWKTFQSFAKIYLIWSLIYLVIQIPDWIETGWFSFHAFIDWGSGLVRNGSYYHLWYLLCMIYALPVCYYILKWISVDKIIYLAIFFYAFEVLEYAYRNFLPNEVQIIFNLYDKGGCIFIGLTRALPFLLFGMLIAHKGVIRFRDAIIGLLISGTGLICEARFLKNMGQNKVSYIAMTFLVSYFFFNLIKNLDSKIKIKNSKIFATISATIYYIHPLFIKVISKYVSDEPFVLYISVVIVSTICAVLISRVKTRLAKNLN